MITKRQVVVWLVAALCGTTLLAAALIWQQRIAQTRWSIFMVGDPHLGAQLFFQEKNGCAHCHSVNGVGAKLAPDLGYAQSPQAGLNQLVSALWNHAPRMWERMRTEKIAYPDLRNQEMTHLFAFLYTARYLDERGDQDNGQRLFHKKGCAMCHTVGGEGGAVGPDLSSLKGVDTPIRWTEAMWNHAPAMEKGVERLHMSWPLFQGREMNDLLAYVRANCGGQRRETELLPANPDRGKRIFQSKSCIECHAVHGKGGHVGPDLGASTAPVTLVQFAGLMWNHSPQMSRTAEGRSVARPTFEGQEIADLLAYLASLNYFDLAGTAAAGQTLFGERGCSACHGGQAEGAQDGPALRGRGRPVTAITLATALWQHGPKMYQRTRERGLAWPTLNESDVGDVVAFLNAPPEGTR
jgi:mono/diheme cytochrome c family protein